MKEYKEYTEKIHAERVKKMLKKKGSCGRCPAGRNYSFKIEAIKGYWIQSQEVRFSWDGRARFPEICKICTNFIGLKPMSRGGECCPCLRLGKRNAIERTIFALEEKGYLE